MSKADKGASNKGKKGESRCGTFNVDPYVLELSEVLIAVQLLETAEEPIVFQSTCALETYVRNYGKAGLVYLQEQDLLGKLFKNLRKYKSIRAMCLKMLAKLTQIENIIPTIQKFPENIKTLIEIFMASDDIVEMEYTSYLLSRICVLQSCGELLCREYIIRKLFKNVGTAKDLDVKYNCLKLIFCIVSCNRKKQIISTSESFDLNILNSILQGKFPILRPVTVDIFNVITYWDQPAMQEQLFHCETMTHIFDVLAENDWTTVQNKALTSIYNCMKYHPVQIKSVGSNEFLKFVNFARNGGPDHALACISVIGALAKDIDNRQVLMERQVHTKLIDFCKYDCDLIYMKFCETLSEFSKNCLILKHMATANTLKEIERLIRNTNLPWNPYRQAAIHPLYLFLMNNPQIGILLYQSNVLKYILEALLHKNEIEKFYYIMAIEMFQCMLGSRCLHRYLWNQDIYCRFVTLLDDCDTDYVKLAIDIVQRTLCCKEFRQWFIEMNGVEYITKMLCKRDCDYLDLVITFCKLAVKYDDIGILLLRSSLIPVFQDIGASAVTRTRICDKIVDDIYKCEYSIKFHDTCFLDYQEIIKNGFCTYIGYKPRNFPPEEVTDVEKLPYTSTIITVNFHGKNHQLIQVIPPQDFSYTDTFTCSSYVIQSYDYTADYQEEKYIFYNYKLVAPTPDKDPYTDLYLKNYLRKVRDLLKSEDTLVNKITILAKFVVDCLNGNEGILPTKHQYEVHFMELKTKLLSNYIPLGYIRIGGIMERALLFKVLADRLGIPCALHRASDFCMWNQVIIKENIPNCLSTNLRCKSFPQFVVNLMDDVGMLLCVGHYDATDYCNKSEKYNRSLM